MSMVSNNGKRFENRIKSWHKGIDCITFKVPDYGNSHNSQKVLCDRITITKKGVFFFECKHTNSKTNFSKSLIKTHQLKNMLQLERMGANAFFLIEDGNGFVYKVKPSQISAKIDHFKPFLIDKRSFI